MTGLPFDFFFVRPKMGVPRRSVESRFRLKNSCSLFFHEALLSNFALFSSSINVSQISEMDSSLKIDQS